MNLKLQSCFFFLIVLSSLVYGQAHDNEELEILYNQDQAARIGANINWNELSKQDSLRRDRIQELMRAQKLNTGMDYYRSAMIFQHVRDSADYHIALTLIQKAIDLDSLVNKWLFAAATDRYLLSIGKPQIWGTQYVKKGENARWERALIDTSRITDKERQNYGVKTLKEQREVERCMNLPSIVDYYFKTVNLKKTLELIKSEYLKAENSNYDVSESAVNDLGYALAKSGKIEEALKIFVVNTQLHPEAFNTWDSLGECLLKLNRKNEGLAAYSRSLQLNPRNHHAKENLEKYK